MKNKKINQQKPTQLWETYKRLEKQNQLESQYALEIWRHIQALFDTNPAKMHKAIREVNT